MKTIKQNVNDEITVKKSKFIANLIKIHTEKEAQEIIKEINKKYHDAKHNCYAYIIHEVDENGAIRIIEKSSDNGEPSGTAGAPMLDILKKQGISNVLIIVTRYFGGILLGTGGLVKAYSDATLKTIENVEFIKKEIGVRYSVEIAYSELKNFEYNCKKLGANIAKTSYGENINLIVEVEKSKEESLKNIEVPYIKIEIMENNIWVNKEMAN